MEINFIILDFMRVSTATNSIIGLVYFQETFQRFLSKKSMVLVGSCKFLHTVTGRAVGQNHNRMSFLHFSKKVTLIGSSWGRGTMTPVLIHSTTA